MVSEEQTITEPEGATCHGKRSTKGTVVSKIFGANRKGAVKGRSLRGISNMRVLSRTSEVDI
jgi:hypothetical protein